MSRARLMAILAADLEGFSTRLAENENGAIELLRRALWEPAERHAKANGGRLFRKEGDGIWCCFDSATGAVSAAFALQEEALRARAGLRLRVGVHLGEVVIGDDGDVVGHELSVAKRLETACEPGGVLVSAELFSHAALDEPGRFAFDPPAKVALKGIGEHDARMGRLTPARAAAIESGTATPGTAAASRRRAVPTLAIAAIAAIAAAGGAFFLQGAPERAVRAQLAAGDPGAAFALALEGIDERPSMARLAIEAARARAAVPEDASADEISAALIGLVEAKARHPALAPLGADVRAYVVLLCDTVNGRKKWADKYWQVRDAYNRVDARTGRRDPDLARAYADWIGSHNIALAFVLSYRFDAIDRGLAVEDDLWPKVVTHLEASLPGPDYDEASTARAIAFARKHHPEKLREWAVAARESGNPSAWANAIAVLAEDGKPPDDPWDRAALAFLRGKASDADVAVLAATDDPVRGARVLHLADDFAGRRAKGEEGWRLPAERLRDPLRERFPK